MVWTFAVGPGLGTTDPDHQLTAARKRRLLFSLDAAPTCTFTVDGRHVDGQKIIGYETDVWASRDEGGRLARCRVLLPGETIDANRHLMNVTAVGYRWLLENARQVGAAGRYFAPGTDQAVIAWTLIAESQALDAGDLGITNGIGSTSATTRELTLKPGAKVGAEIGKLGRLDNGFEWEIDADLAFNRWYPQRGSGFGVVLDYGGLVDQATPKDPPAWGNAVLVTGKEGLTPVEDQTADILTDPRGRWELAEGYPTVEEQATLNAKAPALVSTLQALRSPWVVRIAQYLDLDGEPTGRSRWEGPDHVWLGDTVGFRLTSGRYAIDDPFRVAEIAVDITDDGGEIVTMGLVAA